MKLILVTTIVLFWAASLEGYKTFQQEIPNGNIVPNPCISGSIWDGVGHEDHRGGGPRNPFGADFFAAGKQWTQELCQKDSDGDGRTNGQELGDPNCVWSKGSTPAITDPNELSHPGLCEPLDSELCLAKNHFLTECDALGLTTPATDSWCPPINEPGVKSIEVRFTRTFLSAEETIYMCQLHELPSDDEYEIIAWEPIIDNREVLHHMALFACDYDPTIIYPNLDKNMTMDEPAVCRMTPPCASMIMVWAYGIGGQCFNKEYGAYFGKGSYKKVIVQNHYNNEARKPGFSDSSGLKLYYQRKVRPQIKGTLSLGGVYIIVPPNTPYVEVTSTFTSKCSERFLQPSQRYFLTSMLVHVHKQGVFAKLIINKVKAGYKIVLVNKTIEYDRPETADWKEPHQILLEPGDEVAMTCGYESSKKNEWTFFGPQTSDEMCFAMIDIWPRPSNMNYMAPISMADVDYCEALPNGPSWNVRGCNYLRLYQRLGLKLGGGPTSAENSGAMELIEACTCWGADYYPARQCSSVCYSAMAKFKMFNDACIASDPVWQIGLRPFFQVPEELHRAHSQMMACQALNAEPPEGQGCAKNIVPDVETTTKPSNANSFQISVFLLILNAVLTI